MDRILTFHHHGSGQDIRMAPFMYYTNAEYEKVAVRIHAKDAPNTEAEINIYVDGVSIFNEREDSVYNRTTGVATSVGSGTGVSSTVVLLATSGSFVSD